MAKIKFILREWCLIACTYLLSAVFGFALALPAIIAPTLSQEGADIRGTDEQTSWYLTSCGLAMPISYFLLPYVMQVFGRKCALTIANIGFFVGSIVIAKASNVTSLIIGRAILGSAYAGMFVTATMVAEYTHPKRRSFFLVIKLFITYGALLVGHYFGSKQAWRELAWLSTGLISLCAIITFLIPESPAWLAYKGRYDDCARSFKYMRGEDVESMKELNELICAQKQLCNSKADYGTGLKATAKTLKSKKFLKVAVTTVVLLTLYETSGCNYIIVNLVQIMTKMTDDQTTAYYFTMSFDIVRILSVLLSCVLVRIFKRKTLLVWSAGVAYCLLGLVCICYYESNVTGEIKIKWLAPTFLLMCEAVCSSGFFSVVVIYMAEIFPLKYRGIGLAVIGLVLGLGDASTSKLTPSMIHSFDIHGTFGLYLLISIVLLPIAYILLPETKNITLQEIENNVIKFKNKTIPVSNRDESKTLIVAPLNKEEGLAVV